MLRAVLLVVLSAVTCLESCTPAPSYESARIHEAQRADYLARIAAKARLPDHVARIEYRTDDSLWGLLPETRNLAALPAILTVRDDLATEAAVDGGRRSRIIVLPGAFDATQVESETVFLLALLDHEGAHARLNWAGFTDPALRPGVFRALPDKGGQWLYYTASELVAYGEELEAAKRYNLPDTYWKKAYGAYVAHYARLFRPPVPLPEGLQDHLLISFFRPWMSTVGVVVLDREQWRFVAAGEEYELPQSVGDMLSSEPSSRSSAPLGRL